EARDRAPGERKQYRESRFQAHFQNAGVLELPPSRLLNLDWTAGFCSATSFVPHGTVVGLVNHQGFCLGLGLLDELRSERLRVLTRWRDPDAVTWVQVGKVRFGPAGEVQFP